MILDSSLIFYTIGCRRLFLSNENLFYRPFISLTHSFSGRVAIIFVSSKNVITKIYRIIKSRKILSLKCIFIQFYLKRDYRRFFVSNRVLVITFIYQKCILVCILCIYCIYCKYVVHIENFPN